MSSPRHTEGVLLLITNRFPPAIDGIGDYTFYLGRALQKKGYQVHILCRHQSSYTSADRMTIHTIPADWYNLTSVWIADCMAKIRPDWVVLQYNPYSFQTLGIPYFLPSLLRAFRKYDARVAVMFHEVHIRPKGAKGLFVHLLQRRIAGALCRLADLVQTSIPFYQNLLSPFRTDARLIPIGANLPPGVWEGTAAKEFRETLFPGKSYILSTFGARNLSTLIQAVEQLNRIGLPVGLLVCGKNESPALKQHPSSVRHTGWLPAADILANLGCSDLFVLPDLCNSRREGGTCLKSGSLAAAYAVGLPVVGVWGDMTDEPLVHGENIWLALENTPEALAKAVQQVLTDKALRQTLRQGSTRLYEQALSWNSIAEQYHQNLCRAGHTKKRV